MLWQKLCTPREIYYGQGALDYLGIMSGRRALVVTDTTLQRLGWADLVRQKLGEKGIECHVFDEVESDPSRETVDRGMAAAFAFEPDLIIALGGGSCIDAGKAIWARYEHPDLGWDAFFTDLPWRKLRAKARLVAIPTTSGSGSEASASVVIANRSVIPYIKNSTRADEIIPDIAIVDPTLTATMPAVLTADSGFDALAHAIESYASNLASDVTEALSIKATQLIFAWLPTAVADGNNLVAREKMHNASLIAGMAFTTGRLGICRALARPLGAAFGVSHGRANAFMLPYVIAFNAATAPERYGEIAAELDLFATSPVDGARQLVKAVRQLQQEVGIPWAIRSDGLPEDAFISAVEELTQRAMNDGAVLTNPRLPTVEQMRTLYLQAWSGEDPIIE